MDHGVVPKKGLSQARMLGHLTYVDDAMNKIRPRLEGRRQSLTSIPSFNRVLSSLPRR